MRRGVHLRVLDGDGEMWSTISELAIRYQVSRPAIYHWLRTGQIGDQSVTADSSGVTRIKTDVFAQLLRSGALMRKSGRRSSSPAPTVSAEVDDLDNPDETEAQRVAYHWDAL